ncbi:Gfo/Idh/MocA family protein [Actinomadura sp. 3N407]|uniref:Gfo/Idh/MocA family protein n=1 Tax=Actinomadura sp. 3N407 TaxID=3457423 RepID=UPI003FCC49E9
MRPAGRGAEALAGPLGARADVPDAVFRTGLDAVVIATPTSTHAELLVRACDAGVPAFCEKPVAPDLRATLEVRDRAAKTGIPVHIGFQRPFDAGYAAARRAVLDRRLGSLHRVHLVTADPGPPGADYVRSSGGIFRDCHIHDFDILRWVTGREIESVTAVGANRGDAYFAAAGDVDTSAAVMVLDDGTIATLQGSRYNGAGHDVRMELSGTAGTWVVGLDERAAIRSAEPGVDWPSGDAWTDFWERFQPAYASEIGTSLEMAKGTVTLAECRRGESDLVHRDGMWFLLATCEVPEADSYEPVDWIGMDRGIVNLATTSDGANHQGRSHQP